MTRLPAAGTALALAVGLCAFAAAAGAEKSPAVAAGASAQPVVAPPKLPDGWKLLYAQTFDKPASLDDFEFTSPDKWKHAVRDKAAGNGCLESLGTGKYRPKVRSPYVIALISGRLFGDFILDVDLLQTGKEYGHRDLCLFLGFTGASKYYYVHMATKADRNAHNVFIVNDKPRTNIARKTTKGIDWGKGKWHHVRLVRKAAPGTIQVFFDDMSKPIMEAESKTFPTGRIGFGSFDDVGMVDNVRIYGPKVTATKTKLFWKKGEKASGK